MLSSETSQWDNNAHIYYMRTCLTPPPPPPHHHHHHHHHHTPPPPDKMAGKWRLQCANSRCDLEICNIFTSFCIHMMVIFKKLYYRYPFYVLDSMLPIVFFSWDVILKTVSFVGSSCFREIIFLKDWLMIDWTALFRHFWQVQLRQ